MDGLSQDWGGSTAWCNPPYGREIGKWVKKTLNYGDITKIDETQLPKNLDLLTYGFPCQDISIAGAKKGLYDEEGNKTPTP